MHRGKQVYLYLLLNDLAYINLLILHSICSDVVEQLEEIIRKGE